eukprot:gene24903-11377_t
MLFPIPRRVAPLRAARVAAARREALRVARAGGVPAAVLAKLLAGPDATLNKQ